MVKTSFHRLLAASLITITILFFASPDLARAESMSFQSPAQRDQLVDTIRPGTPQHVISLVDSRIAQKTFQIIEQLCIEGATHSKSVWTPDYCRQEVAPLLKSARLKTVPASQRTVQERFVQGH